MSTQKVANRSTLPLAAGSSSLDVVQYLVSLGSYVNAKNDSGFTPLHESAQHGNLDIANTLFRKEPKSMQKQKAARLRSTLPLLGTIPMLRYSDSLFRKVLMSMRQTIKARQRCTMLPNVEISMRCFIILFLKEPMSTQKIMTARHRYIAPSGTTAM
jgi:hypothetical protein